MPGRGSALKHHVRRRSSERQYPARPSPPDLLRPGPPPEHPRSTHPCSSPSPPGFPTLTAPLFYIIGRQPLRPGAILLATVAAVGALSSVLYALRHTGYAHLTSGSS